MFALVEELEVELTLEQGSSLLKEVWRQGQAAAL